MKVLHFISGLTSGGAETMLCKLAPALREHGIRSEVLCLGPRGPLSARLEADGIPVTHLGLSRNVSSCFRFGETVLRTRRFRPDVVQGWMSHGNLAALAAAGPQGIPVYWGIHQSLYALRHERPLNAALIRLCGALSGFPRGIVYVSRTAAGQHARLGYVPRRAVVIPVGFDPETFRPLPSGEKRAQRLRLGLEPDAMWVGLVARDDPKKDQAGFIEAAARVAARVPGVRFLLLGRNMERPGNPLHERVRALGLEDRFLFHGETPEPQAWIGSLDVLASSSYTEAFPNVIGEAMACGVPCAVTDVGDCAFVLGGAGSVVPPRDPEALAAALTGLLEADAAHRAALGAMGRERIRAEFSIRAVAARYAALYQGRETA